MKNCNPFRIRASSSVSARPTLQVSHPLPGGVMRTDERVAADVIEEFRRRLWMDRLRLLRTVTTTDEELRTLEAHPAGSPTEDVATELARSILSRLEGQEKHELDEIDAAQTRLATGIFGACEDCGAPIPLARLRAMPTARYCMGCQVRRE